MSEDRAVDVVQRVAEVADVTGRLLLEGGQRRSQRGVGRVTRETERQRLRLRVLDDGEARHRLPDVEPVGEIDHELADYRPLGRRERSVEEEGDIERRVVRVEYAACYQPAQQVINSSLS